MWDSKDNGEAIHWQDAKKYCENYRAGGYSDWRMPGQDEMAGLFDKNKINKATQRSHNVHLTELIQVSTALHWASDTSGSNAAQFSFASGARYWNLRSHSLSFRALPVRNAN